jgi:hypothetical protein
MKKFIFLFILLISFSFAAYVNNPASPKTTQNGFFTTSASWGSVRIGYEGDFITNARLKQNSLRSNKIDDYDLDYNSGILTINFVNRCDFFASCGACKTSANWRQEPTNSSFNNIEVLSKAQLGWSAGGKIILFEWINTSLGIGGRYFYTKPNINYGLKDGSSISFDSKAYSKFRSWQVDMCLSHRVDLFTPYIGTKYLHTRAKIKGANTTISDNLTGSLSMKNKDTFGLIFGVSISKGQVFTLNIEGRLVDEEAFGISGDIRF